MPSEAVVGMAGIRARYYRWLFVFAAVWNALSACAVLFLLTNPKFRQDTGFPGSADTISLQLLASCLFVFGLGYYWVSCDLSRNRDLVKLGVIGKPLVFLVFFAHALAQGIPWPLTVPSVVDVLFGVLFLEFLLRTRGKAQ
jgi:hypothetical protein